VTQHDVFAALGRLCFRRRRWVIIGWVLLVVAGGAIGSQVFSRLSDDSSASTSESAQGFNLGHAANINGDHVIALIDHTSADDPTTRRAVIAAAADVRHMQYVDRVRDAYNDHTLRNSDGTQSLVVVDLHDNLTGSYENHLMAQVGNRLSAIPAGRVRLGGDALLYSDFANTAQSDAERGEAFAFPVALIALIFVFGGLVAAALPLISAMVAIAGSLVFILIASYITHIASYSVNIVTMLGLGLAIDYSLLTVNRFREERAAGFDIDDAVERTVATAGRTVAFSAMTVIAAFAGLLVFNEPIFRSLAAGGMGVVIVAFAAALTLVPALLSAWGGRIKPGRSTDHGMFSRLAAWVHRRPVPIVIVVGAALLAAGVPFLHAKYRNLGADELPASSSIRQVSHALVRSFPAEEMNPVHVMAVAPPTDPRVVSYVAGLRQRPDVVAVSETHGSFHNVNRDTGQPQLVPVTNIMVVPTGGSQSPAAQHLVRDLRAHRPPFAAFVTGDAAYLVDFEHAITHSLPYALLLVCLATIALLFLMTGSLLIPIKALVMNFLSLGATFGVLVWVFQDGHFAGLVGASPSGALETVVPVLVFVFAFGLSMDYEVFLISRVRELVDAGLDNQTAVERALQRSGRIITSAAVLIVIVFVGFASAQATVVKEMGVALSTAVIVDVTLVRCLLVPATMTLLGDLNWWAPRWLRRIHARVGIREHVALPTPTVVTVDD
jgi:RND superfamily putative drug exporter